MPLWAMAGGTSPTDAQAIARRLRALRGALKKTQKEMTLISGSVGRGQKWANYETYGATWRRIGLNTALRLWREHRVPIEWVYLGDPHGLPPKLAADIQQWLMDNPDAD